MLHRSRKLLFIFPEYGDDDQSSAGSNSLTGLNATCIDPNPSLSNMLDSWIYLTLLGMSFLLLHVFMLEFNSQVDSDSVY